MIGQLTFGLGGQTVKKLRRLACKFDIDQSDRWSPQVNASPRKAWSNGVASRPKFSTCFSVFASPFGQGFKAMDDAVG